MRTIIKTLTFASIAIGTAKTTAAQNFHIGAKLGASIYKNSGDDIDNKYKGFPLGGVYLGASGEKMSLHLEGLFTQTTMVTGNSFNQVFNSYLGAGKEHVTGAKFSFTEFSVPVLVGFKALPFTWFEVGPQFTKIVSMSDKESILKEVSNVHKDSYLSGVLGLRVKLPFHLQATGRYAFGITDRNNTTISENWRTQHFQLALGIGL
jgi:hypothetical protein